jgi:hypothetical protein
VVTGIIYVGYGCTKGIPDVDNLRKWIFDFMNTHEWLDRYNSICSSVPAYHDLTAKNKSYEEDSQWHGKEMKGMSWYLLGVLTQSLQGGSHGQRPIFNGAIEHTQALLEFFLYPRYKSHDDATLSVMEDFLGHSVAIKDFSHLGGFRKFQMSKSIP